MRGSKKRTKHFPVCLSLYATAHSYQENTFFLTTEPVITVNTFVSMSCSNKCISDICNIINVWCDSFTFIYYCYCYLESFDCYVHLH